MKHVFIFHQLVLFILVLFIVDLAGSCTMNITIEDGPVIQVNESQTLLTLTFLRTGDAGTVSLSATTHSDTAMAGSDFDSSVKMISFGANVNTVTENFTIVDDGKLENYIERFFINITSNSDVCTPYDSVIIQIKDNDNVSIGFKRNFRTFSENVGNISIEFFKSPTFGADIKLTARYFTPDIGNATINTDYKNASNFISFAPDQYTKTTPDALTIIDNDIVENTKCFNVSLDGTHPNIIFPRQSMICILNDDKVTIEFRHSNLSVEEEIGYILVPVIKTGKSAIPITVRMTTNKDYNTAVENVDFKAFHGRELTFGKDVTEMILNVTLINDGEFESVESVFVFIEVLDSSTTIIGNKGVAVIRIEDEIDNGIRLQQQRQIESEQKRRTVLMTYLLYVIVAVIAVMILIFIILIAMIANKFRKYDKL